MEHVLLLELRHSGGRHLAPQVGKVATKAPVVQMGVATDVLPVRRVQFEYPKGTDPRWTPHLPEFAAAANAVSLMMPYAEPLFIKAVRSTYDRIDDELRARTETYIKQEVGHYTQHKRFNDVIALRYPATVGLQRWMDRWTNFVWRRSKRFNVAFAAGGETISYGVARWTEKHLAALMDQADPVPATLYLWHLAEEIEHKSSTYDVFEAVDGSRLRYAWALLWGFLCISSFTAVATLMQLWTDRRLWKPITWWRLLRLSASLAFVLVPVMVESSLRSHHPTQMTDPSYLPMWLKEYDPETGTMPIWRAARSTRAADAPDRSANLPAA